MLNSVNPNIGSVTIFSQDVPLWFQTTKWDWKSKKKKDFETSKDIILRIKKSFGYVFAIKETVFFIWWFEGAIK